MLVIWLVTSTVGPSATCDMLFVSSFLLDGVVVTVCEAAVEGTRVLPASVVFELASDPSMSASRVVG